MRTCAGWHPRENLDLSYPAYLSRNFTFRPEAGKYHAAGRMSSNIRR